MKDTTIPLFAQWGHSVYYLAYLAQCIRNPQKQETFGDTVKAINKIAKKQNIAPEEVIKQLLENHNNA